ncbi:MAG: hypothetical protein M1361_02650 [Patescibacteria group bacterium]|nr:hypothetical protein [Patescibacteria group bacterium]MCL5224475.1 hypothetical protein [Patescibacteria group bacterium]
MQSDLESMRSSGGMGVTPQTFKPEELFNKPIGPAASQVPPSVTSPVAPKVKVVGPKKSGHKIWILVGVLVVLILAWVVIQFFVLPSLQSSSAPAAPAAVPTPAPVATTTTTSTAAPTSTAVTLIHQSFLKSPASASTTVTLSTPLSLAALQADIASSTASSAAAGTFEELVFVNAASLSTTSSTPVSAQSVLGTILPNAAQSFLASTFDQDVTGFVYYNKSGAWPGYIFKLTSGANLATATSTLDPVIEASAPSFFQSSPGTASGSFSNGSLPDSTPVRYLAFSKKGAALEYGWFKGYLVVSTSYQGIIAADQHL